MYLRDLGPGPWNDRIVLLSTCSAESTNGRDILVARLTDQVYEDTYAVGGSGAAGLRISRQGKRLERSSARLEDRIIFTVVCAYIDMPGRSVVLQTQEKETEVTAG